MVKTYDFEVRRLRCGKEVTIAHFKNLPDACIYAEKQNVASREPIFVVRVDIERLVVFDAFPNELVESIKFKRDARYK